MALVCDVLFVRQKLQNIWTQWFTRGVQPPPEIPKALQNHAKLNLIVKTAKNC